MAGRDTGRAREPGRGTGSVARVAVMDALALVLAVSSVYLVLIGLTAGTLWFVLPGLASQAAELMERLPEVAEEVSGDVDKMADTAEDAGVPVMGDVAAT